MDLAILLAVFAAIFYGELNFHATRREIRDLKAMVGTTKAQLVNVERKLAWVEKAIQLIPATRVGAAPAAKSERDLFEAGEWLRWYASKKVTGIEEKGPPIGEVLIDVIMKDNARVTARADLLDWSDIGPATIARYRKHNPNRIRDLEVGGKPDWADTLAAEIEEFAAQKDETQEPSP